MKHCPYCDEDSYSIITLSSRYYISLELDNNAGDVAIIARGDEACSYKHKFCPECGRKLIKEDSL